MKTILAVIMMATLSGCYQVVSKDDIALANMYCADRGGVKSIKEYATTDTFFKCNDGLISVSEETAAKRLLLDTPEPQEQFNVSCDYKPIRQAGEPEIEYLERKVEFLKHCDK